MTMMTGFPFPYSLFAVHPKFGVYAHLDSNLPKHLHKKKKTERNIAMAVSSVLSLIVASIHLMVFFYICFPSLTVHLWFPESHTFTDSILSILFLSYLS